jgi:hypothetical protein
VLLPSARRAFVASHARYLSSKTYQVSARERADAVLRSKIREPKPVGGKERTVRQLRVGAMLQQAMSEVLDERSLDDPDLYPSGVPVQIVQVDTSPCLRFATFLWAVPLVGEIDPHKFAYTNVSSSSPVGGRGLQASDHEPTEHLSPEMQALVRRTNEMFDRNAVKLKDLLVSRIRMKVLRVRLVLLARPSRCIT